MFTQPCSSAQAFRPLMMTPNDQQRRTGWIKQGTLCTTQQAELDKYSDLYSLTWSSTLMCVLLVITTGTWCSHFEAKRKHATSLQTTDIV